MLFQSRFWSGQTDLTRLQVSLSLSYDFRDVVINQLLLSVMEINEKHAVSAHVAKMTSPVSDQWIHVSEKVERTDDMPVSIFKPEEKYDEKHKSVQYGVFYSAEVAVPLGWLSKGEALFTLELTTISWLSCIWLPSRPWVLNILFSVTFWIQGSIGKSRRHDHSLLRVFERYAAWTLFRSVQVSGRTATTWAQKFWGGQPRPSWETRNGDIQSKYCQNQLITLYIFTQKTLSAKQIVLCNISDARLNQKIPTPWPISPQGVWTLFSSVQVPQGEQLQLSTEALRKSSSPVLRDMERAGKDWSSVSGISGRCAGRLGSSLVPLLLTLWSRHRLTSGVDLEREKTKH